MEEKQQQQVGSVQAGSIKVEELTWGEMHWNSSPLSRTGEKFDIMILAEVFSIPELHGELVWTVKKMTHGSLEIWSIFLNRAFSFMFFALLADVGGYRVQQIPCDEVDLMGMEGDELGIFMHHILFDPQSPRVIASSSPAPS